LSSLIYLYRGIRFQVPRQLGIVVETGQVTYFFYLSFVPRWSVWLCIWEIYSSNMSSSFEHPLWLIFTWISFLLKQFEISL